MRVDQPSTSQPYSILVPIIIITLFAGVLIMTPIISNHLAWRNEIEDMEDLVTPWWVGGRTSSSGKSRRKQRKQQSLNAHMIVDEHFVLVIRTKQKLGSADGKPRDTKADVNSLMAQNTEDAEPSLQKYA